MADPGENKRARTEPDAAALPESALELAGDDQLALQELTSIQRELEEVNDKASDEVLAVEQKYNRLRRPLFLKRNAVCARIPNFWRQALHGHPVLRQALSEDDLDALSYCTGVDVEDFEDIKSGFKVAFTFAEDNPYFSNRQLVKTLKFSEDATLLATGTRIDWREGKEPADSEPAVGSKRAANEGCMYAFFTQWLGADDTYDEALQDDIANYIKEDVWPDPFRYYSDPGSDMEADEYEENEGYGAATYDDDDDYEQQQGDEQGEGEHELDQEADDDNDDDEGVGDEEQQQEGQQPGHDTTAGGGGRGSGG